VVEQKVLLAVRHRSCDLLRDVEPLRDVRDLLARIHVGSDVHELRAGDSLLAPKGVPHTYIAGDEGARWLVTTSPGNFERFVLAVSRPAEAETLPPAPPGPPSVEEVERVNRVAADHGIEILGPPGALPS
jgi:hypothetical protein